MQAYDIQNLPTDLQNWLNIRLLPPLLYFEGGWEKWWQSDFPAWLDVSYDDQFDFRREVPSGTGYVIDWVVNGNTASPNVAIELKAQTHKTSTSSFKAQVDGDLVALNSLSPADFPIRMSLIAVIDDATYAAMIQEGFMPMSNTLDVYFLSKTV